MYHDDYPEYIWVRRKNIHAGDNIYNSKAQQIGQITALYRDEKGLREFTLDQLVVYIRDEKKKTLFRQWGHWAK